MADDIKDAISAEVERRVRAEYEAQIQEEIARRLAAVEAAIEGTGTRDAWPVHPARATGGPPPVKPQRKRRSDAGKPRIGRGMTELAAANVQESREPAQAATVSEPEATDGGDEQDGSKCATCGHAEFVHGDPRQGHGSGCMAIDCTCKRFVARENGAVPCGSAS